MTDEESKRLGKIEDSVEGIRKALIGDGDYSMDKGLLARFVILEKDVAEIKAQNKKIRQMGYGLAIGLGVAGVLFGAASWESFAKFIKAFI